MPGQVSYLSLRSLGKLTRHVNGIGEKVTRVCNENDEATLNLGESAHVGKLEKQRGHDAYDDANDQAAKEDEQEYANRLKQCYKCQAALVRILVSLRRFE